MVALSDQPAAGLAKLSGQDKSLAPAAEKKTAEPVDNSPGKAGSAHSEKSTEQPPSTDTATPTTTTTGTATAAPAAPAATTDTTATTNPTPTPTTTETAATTAPAPSTTKAPSTASDEADGTATSATTATTATTAATDASASGTTATATNDDQVNPPDFQGEVATNNDIPSAETLRKIEKYTVLDHNGKSHTFKSLYSGHNTPRRVLVIFIRHFFCGNCQEYLRTLSASITPEALLQLPVSTFIAVIGCGAPELIDSYIKETRCPFPVYADPTRRLYNKLGMVRTLHMGERPAYLQGKTLAQTVISGVTQGLKQVKSGLVTKMGDQRQVGGEFLFEPLSIQDPISTPDFEKAELLHEDDKANTCHDEPSEEKRITWCHRMRTTRDHAEVPELMEVLGLEGDGTPIKDERRWAKALKSRKGVGLSMAKQMNRMSLDSSQVPQANVASEKQG